MTFTRSIRIEPGQPYEQARALVDVTELDHAHKAIFDAGATAARYLVETESGRPTQFGAVVNVTGWDHISTNVTAGSIGLNISITLPPAEDKDN